MGFLLGQPCRSSIEDLVVAAQASDTDDALAMTEIVRRFEGLAVNICAPIKAPANLWDDLLNAARFGLVQAVRHHDGQPGFPNFAKLYMRGAALRELDRWIVPEIAGSEAVDRIRSHRYPSDPIGKLINLRAPWGDGRVAAAIAELSDGQKQIIDLRYGQDLPVKEIATVVGTSAPAVSQRLATIHRHVALALAA
jgi:RNA polymerase sigma factor (sigma-70 family)